MTEQSGVVVTTWATTGEAEHAVLGLTAAQPDLVLATHFSEGGVVVTSRLRRDPVRVHRPGPTEGDADADLMHRHTARRSGRLFHYPGVDELVGRMTVRRLIARSVVDHVVMLGRPDPLEPHTVVDTQGFVRPHFVDGRVVLDVRPAAGGVAIPFEQRHPTPCCADH